MTLKSYLWGIKLGTLISSIVLIAVILEIDPEKSGIVGQLFFYASMLLFLSSFLISMLTWLRKKTADDGEELFFTYLSVSFRQGILLAILLIALLVLQQNRIFTWWDGALTLVGILLGELYFLTRK